MEECKFVGRGMADFAGIGIMVGFIGQAIILLELSLWVFSLSKTGNLDVTHEEGSIERKIEHKRLEFISDILMIGNDIQMTLGVSYMVTVFCQWDTIDLYHLHLAFDAVSFAGVSNAAALVCWSFCAIKLPHEKRHHTKHLNWFFTPRHKVTYGFAAMFITLTILLGLRLDEWHPEREPGRCYHSSLITTSNARHPTADKVYVAITAVWMLLAMFSAAFFGAMHRRWILVSVFLQFPVHSYMTIALRTENQGKLAGEEKDENAWDFGQTTAVVLLGAALEELGRKFGEYRRFEKESRSGKDANDDMEMKGLTEASTRVTQTETMEGD